MILHTQSYSEEENLILSKEINEKFENKKIKKKRQKKKKNKEKKKTKKNLFFF